jgi:hypothetical protein
VLVSEGNEGVDIPEPDIEQADVPLDEVVHVGEQLMHRMPAFESAGLAASWTGVYDVTPDWNPVLGPVDGVPGLHLAYGSRARFAVADRRPAGGRPRSATRRISARPSRCPASPSTGC